MLGSAFSIRDENSVLWNKYKMLSIFSDILVKGEYEHLPDMERKIGYLKHFLFI